jgi:hypothetical protein
VDDDEEWWDDPPPILEPMAMTQVQVEVTENPVVAELLGPGGEVLRQWRERPPFGFQTASGTGSKKATG